jgi:hypothetical protein
MGWLALFVDEEDSAVLLRWLSAEPQVAFLLADGPGRWKAVKSVERLADGHYCLWHISGAPLPLLRNDGTEAPLPDPWQGWREERPGADRTAPYFGDHPSIFRLDLRARHRPYSAEERTTLSVQDGRLIGEKDCLWLSDFQWDGNHFGPAPRQTQRWWQRLKRWMSRSTTKLTTNHTSFWAFPSARKKLLGGMSYSANGFDLTKALGNCRCNEPAGPVAVPSVLPSDVVRLAESLGNGEDVAFALHDALLDAGCGELADHFRENEHLPNCWALAMILGKG